MVKKYRRLSDKERHELIVLVHTQGYTIKDASKMLNIPYPNAKAVNQTYLHEHRTAKKSFRIRLKSTLPHHVDRSEKLLEHGKPIF
jgi:transposase